MTGRSDSALVVVEDHGISRNRVGLERLGSEQAVGFVLNSPADEIIGVHPLPRTADGDEQFLVPGLGVGLGGRLYSGGGYHIFPIVRFLSRFVRLFFRRQFQFVEIDGRRGLLRREQRFARNGRAFPERKPPRLRNSPAGRTVLRLKTAPLQGFSPSQVQIPPRKRSSIRQTARH